MTHSDILQHVHLLVIDDQKAIRGVIAQGLRRLGAEVIEADDGYTGLNILGLGSGAEVGLERLRKQRPDFAVCGRAANSRINCIVTDIRMAPMNGLEMLKAVRVGYSSAPRDLPVIVMSAHTDEPLIGAAIALDAHAFVSKPISQATILDRIQRAMRVKLLPKPVDIYRKLIIPVLDETTLQTDVGQLWNHKLPKIQAEDVNALSGEWTIKAKLAELSGGDIFAVDFKTVAGHMVIPAGTRVTELLIGAINDLAQVTELSDEIHVTRTQRH
jgi:CheY-like chemotaxis protein